MSGKNLVEMTWDPVTRVIGSLGIHTRIDFDNREVAECRATSSIFRGYSVFMRGKDPRDAHFVTSRICGICGDNHATCAVYAQNMAFGVKPPALAEWIINCAEAAEYMFDHNLFQDNLVGVDFCERMVPLHDDLFDFFLQALPGYERVGQRRILLGCWGAFQNPEACDFRYQTMPQWGREMFVTPGIVIDGELVSTDLVEINLGIRILLGSSFYDDWEGQETFVKADPLGNPIDQRHPWNQTTLPRPQKRDLQARYTWVMSPRWLDRRTGAHLALDSGGGPLARLWVTALAGKVDFPGVKATGSSVKIRLPRTAQLAETELEWKIPRWSNTLERDRARSYFQAYAAAAALHFIDRGRKLVHGGDTRTWNDFKVPDEAIGCGFHEAVRGLLSHHMVIRNGRIANYHPYPPTPWNASPRDSFGTPGPYEDAIQGSPLFEENGPESFKGIDIMRTVRSFDPCLPCGVHMMLGGGKVLELRHSPAFGAQVGGL